MCAGLVDGGVEGDEPHVIGRLSASRSVEGGGDDERMRGEGRVQDGQALKPGQRCSVKRRARRM